MFPLTLLIAIMGRERQFVAQLHRPAVLAAFWLMAAALLVDLSVLSTMLHHVQGYLKRAGDAVATGTPDPLVFPSVAQSIIEIQDLTLTEILVYFHPWQPIAILGLLGFLFVLCARSGALFLVPLALLALLSTKMGGRMVMFGAPIVAIGLTLPVDWLACALGDVRAKTTRKVFFLACLILAGLILLVPSCRETMIELWNSLGWLHFVIMGCLLAMFVIGSAPAGLAPDPHARHDRAAPALPLGGGHPHARHRDPSACGSRTRHDPRPHPQPPPRRRTGANSARPPPKTP